MTFIALYYEVNTGYFLQVSAVSQNAEFDPCEDTVIIYFTYSGMAKCKGQKSL